MASLTNDCFFKNKKLPTKEELMPNNIQPMVTARTLASVKEMNAMKSCQKLCMIKNESVFVSPFVQLLLKN